MSPLATVCGVLVGSGLLVFGQITPPTTPPRPAKTPSRAEVLSQQVKTVPVPAASPERGGDSTPGAVIPKAAPAPRPLAAPAPWRADDKNAVPRPDPWQRVRVFRDLLNQVHPSYDGVDDPKITLEQFLNSLTKQYEGLNFVINEPAFAGAEVPEPLHLPIGEKKVPKMKNVRLSTYLRTALDRLTVRSGVTYVFRRDGVEITTKERALSEFYRGRREEDLAVLPPLVHARFEARPLNEALRELADAAENFNVVLAPGLREATMPVTGTFHNVPLDTVVETLAEMAGLAVKQKGNVLYVSARQERIRARNRIR